MTARTAISPRLADKAVYDQIIPARSPWSGIVRKAQVLRIVDLEGQQAVDTLFYSADDFGERYCAQATLAGQGSAYIGLGTPVLSTRGRVMLTMTADTVGEHDTSAGARSFEAQTPRLCHHNRHKHAPPENFLVEPPKN